MTASQGMVTGERPGGASSPAMTGAQRMAALRARKRAEREAARRMSLDPRERAAEARQAGLPLGPAGGAMEPIEAPRAGRPGGSVARATAMWRDRLLATYRSPLIVLAETYSRPLVELARELGCTPLEAFKVQVDAAKDLAGYLHSKMPTAVQLEGAPMVGVTIGVTEAKAAEMGIAPDGVFRLPKIVEHQPVSDGENGDV